MNEKEILRKNIARSMPIMGQIHDLEDELENLEDEVAEKDKKIGCVMIGVVVFTFLLALLGIDGTFMKNRPGEILAVLPFPIIMFFIIRREKRVKKCKARITQLNEQLTAMKNDSVLSWLPMDYRTASAFASIGSYVSNGRADTLKEALNLFENEMQQQRIVDATFLGAYYANQP